MRGFDWPIRATFSVDGRFIFVADSGRGRGLLSLTIPSVIALSVADHRLTFVESFRTSRGELANARGIAIHPKGESLFVAASESQSLVSLRNDRDTGKLQLVQVIRNDEAVVDVLDGAMSVLVDPTGRHIYTLAGRFRGAGAIGVFSYSTESGEITLLEGHKSGSPGLEGFAGGNQLALSPNGSRVYAIGTTSGTLSILDRNQETGKLTPIETVAFRSEWNGSVAGVAVSPNSRFVYVSGAEKDPSITVLEVLP